MTLLELLESDNVEEFNNRRGQRAAPEFFACDLAGRKLAGVDLSRANMEKSDLSESDLTGAVLARANFDGADLTEANLSEVVAIRSRWRGAWLGEATFEGGDFTGADMVDAVLDKSHGVQATFRNARLKRAEARGASLGSVDLTEANVEGADFSASDMRGAVLRDARLNGAKFIRTILAGADMAGIKGREVDLSNADLSGAKLAGADLTGADLTGAQLDGADLTRADLATAILKGASLKGARMVDTRLDNANLEDADLEDVITGEEESGEKLDELPPSEVAFEDVDAAISEGSVTLLWENADPGGKLRLRVTSFALGGRYCGVAPPLKVPTDLVLARALVPLPTGFAAVTFVERPGVVLLGVTEISALGDIGSTVTTELEYQPAVRPVVVSDGDGFLIYGLARTGPTLFVHRWQAGELQRLFGQRVPTARGFVGTDSPLLLTKGGTIQPILRDGLGDPLNAPDGFPGRLAACVHSPEGPIVAWTPKGENGFRWAVLQGPGRPVSHRVSPKTGITALDLVRVKGETLALFAREDEGEMSAAGAWGQDLDGGRPFKVLVGGDFDVEDIKVIDVQEETVTALVLALDESVRVVEVKKSRAKLVGRAP